MLAAIQAMGTYKFHMLTFDGWSERISGDASSGEHWRQVFEEHPEFFRLDHERMRASLVWRRRYPKRFHVDRETRLSVEEYKALSQNEKLRKSPQIPEAEPGTLSRHRVARAATHLG